MGGRAAVLVFLRKMLKDKHKSVNAFICNHASSPALSCAIYESQ